MRDYRDRWVTPPRQVTSPTWGLPPPCKQALKVPINVDDVIAFCLYLMNKMRGTPIKKRIFTIFKLFNRFDRLYNNYTPKWRWLVLDIYRGRETVR